jgi:quinol-cytochrome oxidoreductase complex cytochrome b subunit
MILLVRPDADEQAVEALVDRVRGMGLELHPLEHAKGQAFEIVGADRGRALALRGAPAVQEILTRRASLDEGEPVWPHFALRVTSLFLILSVALLLLTAFMPPGLGDKATLGTGDADGALEWYLRPLGAFLDVFSAGTKWLGGALVLLSWLVLLLWPFLDRSDPATPRGRRAVLLMRMMGAAMILLVLLLALRGSP